MKHTLWFIVIGALLGSVLVGQAARYVKLGTLYYLWPSSHAAKALANNGSGTLTWSGDIDSGVPAGLIGFWVASGSCPSGWTEYTAARGRYIVAAGSSIGSTVGTALDANGGENRAAGVHGHTASLSASISESDHDHADSAGNHDHDNIITATGSTGIQDDGGAWTGADSNSAESGLSLNAANGGISATPNLTITGVSGGVTGTNAPYIRMLVCQKQ